MFTHGGWMVNDIGHIFGKIVLFLRGGSQCDEFLVRAQICKNAGGVRAHFLQKYERYTGKITRADSEIFNFSNMARIVFLTVPKRSRSLFLIL